MVQLTTPSLVAIATGVVGSAWASGAIASISLAGIPAIKLIPQTSAQCWAELFARGIALMPKVAITVAASYCYAAYDAHNRGEGWTGYAAAGALVVGIVPFTIIAMGPTNDALHGAASGASVLSGAQVAGLIDRWSTLNLVRSVFPLVSAATGLATFLGSVL